MMISKTLLRVHVSMIFQAKATEMCFHRWAWSCHVGDDKFAEVN